MNKKILNLIFLLGVCIGTCGIAQHNPIGQVQKKPNIVIIYLDDLGYGVLVLMVLLK